MNYAELSKLIEDYIETRQNAIDNGEEDCDYEKFTQALVEGEFEKADLPINLIYETPSYDGEKKEWVFEHKNGEESIFVMFTGWYSSYEGCEVDDDFEEVRPYTFTETRYK